MRHTKTHTLCRRCDSRSFHRQHKVRIPQREAAVVQLGLKAKRRKTTGTGRLRHLKGVGRRFKNGFRENTAAPARKSRATAEA
ncbi:60S ribosomal protein L37 [Auriculariales sp. MPI-PUGE-AT-0066]|nr:60S ribosomal protein L37 [Auriculariales sp. MPI-PUGE-AT-0066]